MRCQNGSVAALAVRTSYSQPSQSSCAGTDMHWLAAMALASAPALAPSTRLHKLDFANAELVENVAEPQRLDDGRVGEAGTER
jgi:hypothetical protein